MSKSIYIWLYLFLKYDYIVCFKMWPENRYKNWKIISFPPFPSSLPPSQNYFSAVFFLKTKNIANVKLLFLVISLLHLLYSKKKEIKLKVKHTKILQNTNSKYKFILPHLHIADMCDMNSSISRCYGRKGDGGIVFRVV